MNTISSHLLDIVSNQEMRLSWCEYCGSTLGHFETHHIKSRGSGGLEVRANKINLCLECHGLAQQYQIKPHELIVCVAKREKTSVQEVYEAIVLPVPDNIDELERLTKQTTQTTQTVEDLIASLIWTEEYDNEVRFLRGEIINTLVERGLKYSWIASQIGRSTAFVRTQHKTYLAFPTEESRVPTLSWTHHKVAAHTNNPAKWIARAAGQDVDGNETGQEMSTRELRKAILEEEQNITPVEIEEAKSFKKARSALKGVLNVIEKGGESGVWLKNELTVLLQELSTSGFAKSKSKAS